MNDRNINDRETHILPEQIPVEDFQPIDIFAEKKERYRLSAGRLSGKRWKKAKTGENAAESPFVMPVRRSPEAYETDIQAQEKENAVPLTEADEANALYLHAVGGLLVSGWLFNGLARLIPEAIRWPQRAAALFFHVIILALPVARRALRSDDMAEKMRFRRPARGTMWLCCMCGLGAALFGLGVTNLWSRAFAGWGAVISGSTQVGWGQIPLLLVVSGILPAVCEEMFFRGYLLSAWEDRWGWIGIVVCAVLFTLLHGSVLGLPAELAVGLLLGCICMRSGSVFCAILAHMGYNLGVILLSLLWQSSGWMQDAGVALCGAALAMIFYLLMRKLSGRQTVNMPTRRGSGWESALALYAAAATALAMYAMDWMQLFGGV